MNNRGKPLSQADLIKNYLMYLGHKTASPSQQLENWARAWGDVFKQVMIAARDGEPDSGLEDRLLRYHWVLYRESAIPRRFNGLGFSQRLKADIALSQVPRNGLSAEEWAVAVESRNAELRARISDYTLSLRRSSHDFADLYHPERTGAFSDIESDLRERVRDVIASLHRMRRYAAALPLLMAARRRLRKAPAQLLQLAELLSSYCMRVFVLVGRRANAGQSFFMARANQLFAQPEGELSGFVERLRGELRWWIDRYGGDDQVRDVLTDRQFYHRHPPHEIRYLFFEYERRMCSGQAPALDWAGFEDSKRTQIEHIAAQQGKPRLGGTKAAHEDNVHRLGNLTVTHFNQSLSNKPFADKKPIYARSNLIIEHELSRVDEWSLEVVERREQELVDFVLDRWAIAGPS